MEKIHSPEAQSHLWQRFYRVPGITVQDKRGHFGANLGLGLYLYLLTSRFFSAMSADTLSRLVMHRSDQEQREFRRRQHAFRDTSQHPPLG